MVAHSFARGGLVWSGLGCYTLIMVCASLLLASLATPTLVFGLVWFGLVLCLLVWFGLVCSSCSDCCQLAWVCIFEVRDGREGFR